MIQKHVILFENVSESFAVLDVKKETAKVHRRMCIQCN